MNGNQQVLQRLEIVFVSPGTGSGGVGDYASDIRNATRAAGARVSLVDTGGPGMDSVSDVRKTCAQVSELAVRARANGLIPLVHAELSAGCVAPFWAVVSQRGVCRSAIIHDPPHPVWWPAGVKWIHASRWRLHGVHYLPRRLWAGIERRSLQGVHLAALTRTGVESLNEFGLEADELNHYVRHNDDVTRLSKRPRAVGLFGYVYGGKGFSGLRELRAALDDSIAIEVAGRGTENLEPTDGVRIWGPVDGQRQSDFFRSVRCLVLPYESGGRYGDFCSASGALARAYAHSTPAVAAPVRSFPEESMKGGVVVAGTDMTSMAMAASRLISDDRQLELAEAAISKIRMARALPRVAQNYLEFWSTTIETQRLGVA